jgi:molybdate transport system ATP-binding protein
MLQLNGVRVPLAHFELDVTASSGARITGLFGASGAGKTSLLDTIAGIRRLRAGSIVLDGRTLDDVGARTHVPPHARGIGYVPQETALFPHLSARANARYGFPRDASADESRFEHVVDVLEIRPLLDRSVRQLSGGEQKRVALARALLASPRLLLLDEPLSGLDRSLHVRITDLLLRVRDDLGVPMIYVTHQPEELAQLAEETIVIERGTVVRQGPTPQVLAR